MTRRNLKTARQKLAAFTKCPYSSRKDFNAADWMIHDIRKILKGSYYIMGLKRAGKETLMQKKWDQLSLNLFKRS